MAKVINPKVGVFEVGFGNLPSLRRVLNQINVDVVELSHLRDLLEFEHLIIPGVGAFSSAMTFLNQRGFAELIRERCVELKMPTLGICLGAQILLEEGFEGGKFKGIGVFKGHAAKLSEHLDVQSSHNGWNSAQVVKPFLGFNTPSEFDAYFNHDFIFHGTDFTDVCAVSNYGGVFPIALAKHQTYAVQFHPEKSQSAGLELIKSFLGIAHV